MARFRWPSWRPRTSPRSSPARRTASTAALLTQYAIRDGLQLFCVSHIVLTDTRFATATASTWLRGSAACWVCRAALAEKRTPGRPVMTSPVVVIPRTRARNAQKPPDARPDANTGRSGMRRSVLPAPRRARSSGCRSASSPRCRTLIPHLPSAASITRATSRSSAWPYMSEVSVIDECPPAPRSGTRPGPGRRASEYGSRGLSARAGS